MCCHLGHPGTNHINCNMPDITVSALFSALLVFCFVVLDVQG